MEASSLLITGAGNGIVVGWTDGFLLRPPPPPPPPRTRDGPGDGRARDEVLQAPRGGIDGGKSLRLEATLVL